MPAGGASGFAPRHSAGPCGPERFKRLRWREELARLSPLNRQVFLVHAGFVVLITILL